MTTRAPSDLLLEIRLRRDALYLAGRDPQGVAPTPPEQSSTWVVTQVEPVLMAMPVGGAAVSVEATDAVKGVRVGHRIRVEVRGAGSRVAVALLDQLTIKGRDGGDEVAKVNGKPLTVGGSTTITADDRVILDLDVKKDAVSGYTVPPGGGQIPNLDKREITTQVRSKAFIISTVITLVLVIGAFQRDQLLWNRFSQFRYDSYMATVTNL